MMIDLNEIGRLPAPEDNCAIATRTLPAGTAVAAGKGGYLLSHTTLEGHRFAARPIPAGGELLSWGLPFGRALRDLAPGEYVCNERVLNALRGRQLDFELPAAPNFADHSARYRFDPDRFTPALPLPPLAAPPTFMGFPRPGGRGVGTRNAVLLLGVNALVAGFVRQLEQALQPLGERFPQIDGIVAVAHTEGSRADSHNRELLLRTLAGWLVHPNAGAVLVVDAGGVGVTNEMVRAYARRHRYPLDDVLHQFVSVKGPLADDLAGAVEIVTDWLPQVAEMARTPQPLSELNIALQCGGSDAFSGISGNPLAALVAKWVVQGGGSAVLAETDELIGAESYVLQKVRDGAAVSRFLAMVERFQERTAWHGHSAHGNPSGGNLYRGLYNIYLKSLGAAAKRHPDVPLDEVLEYGERPARPGYHFMDSPGNDLESIAGQVASGCNLIYFVTGNGSITNFPFVPTIKIVTTSARYALLAQEMDVNAGAYLDGRPLEELGRETLDLTLAVAAGRRSAGENARHAQVQIWRNWQLAGRVDLAALEVGARPDGRPLAVPPPAGRREVHYQGWQTGRGIAAARLGLIVPSSLCSGQIARLAARRLNEQGVGREKGISRFVALVHTEGCGASTQAEYVDTLLGYLAHPLVATCLILEHGCEITHNDFWRGRMEEAGLEPARYGWASIQLDGGIERVLARIDAWFARDCAALPEPRPAAAGLSALRLGLMSTGEVDGETAAALAELVRQVAAAGGTVILPANDGLMAADPLLRALALPADSRPTLAYAQAPARPGLHLMANPTDQWAETMTGLGATGVELILAAVAGRSQQRHPFIPVLQIAGDGAFRPDLDQLPTGSPEERLAQLLPLIAGALSEASRPAPSPIEDIGFQITRGRLGVSL